MMRRYIDWNGNTGTATEYERSGECNQCGDCCRAHIQFSEDNNLPSMVHANGIPSTTNHEIDDNGKPTSKVLELSPIEIQTTVGETQYSHVLAGIDTSWEGQCPHLTDENECDMHNSKNIFCKEWPMSPQHVAPFENCSYSFTKISSWKFEYAEENASE